MTRLAAETCKATADRALLRVLRRMASFVRHDLAGAMLVPQTHLQLLRRRLQKPGATLDTAIVGIDEALLRLDELGSVHQQSASWLALHDGTPAAVDEVLRKVAIGFGLHFSFIGVSVNCGELVPGPTYPAQPLHLLVNACFFAILDSDLSPGMLDVTCRPRNDGATLEWRLEPASDSREVEASAHVLTDPELCLDPVDLQALCARYGCRVVPGGTRWTLHLDDPSAGTSPRRSDMRSGGTVAG